MVVTLERFRKRTVTKTNTYSFSSLDRQFRAVARLRERRRPPPLIVGQEIKNSIEYRKTHSVAVRILRIGQQISPPPFLRSGYALQFVGFAVIDSRLCTTAYR